MCAAREAISRTFEMVYLIARHLKQPFAIFFAEHKGFQGMIAGHEITYLVWGYRIPITEIQEEKSKETTNNNYQSDTSTYQQKHL